MLQATVYQKRRLPAIPKRLCKILGRDPNQRNLYVQDKCAVFFIKNHDDSICDAREAAHELIKAYAAKWKEPWTHFQLVDGNPFKDGKPLTSYVRI